MKVRFNQAKWKVDVEFFSNSLIPMFGTISFPRIFRYDSLEAGRFPPQIAAHSPSPDGGLLKKSLKL